MLGAATCLLNACSYSVTTVADAAPVVSIVSITPDSVGYTVQVSVRNGTRSDAPAYHCSTDIEVFRVDHWAIAGNQGCDTYLQVLRPGQAATFTHHRMPVKAGESLRYRGSAAGGDDVISAIRVVPAPG